MKTLKLIFLIVSAVLFTNCEEADPIEEIKKEQENTESEEETEEPQEITYFTYKAPNYFNTSDSDDWLIIHDQDGQLLDYRAFEQEDVLVFKKMDSALTSTNNLTITTFTSHLNQTSNVHALNTHPLVPIGSSWNNQIETDSFDENNLIASQLRNGSAFTNIAASGKNSTHNITVSNVPGILKYNITSDITGVITADYNSIDSNVLTLENVNLSPGINYIIFIGDAEGGLKHLFFEIDQNTTDLDLNYEDFVDYDQILETQLPSNSYLFSVSRGHSDTENIGRGYEMTVELDFTKPTTSKIGYIAGYERYTTHFHLTMDSGYGYRYFELSEAPLSEITILPKPSFTLIDKTPFAYQFITDIAYVRAKTTWRYEETLDDGTYVATNWNIQIPDTKALSIGQLPQELVFSAHPKLSLDKLKHGDTDLTIRGNDYTQLLENLENPLNHSPNKIVETIVLKTIEE